MHASPESQSPATLHSFLHVGEPSTLKEASQVASSPQSSMLAEPVVQLAPIASGGLAGVAHVVTYNPKGVCASAQRSLDPLQVEPATQSAAWTQPTFSAQMSPFGQVPSRAHG